LLYPRCHSGVGTAVHVGGVWRECDETRRPVRTLSQQLLEEQEVAYEAEEDQYTEEIERLETLPLAFEEGSWTWDDLEWIVRSRMTGSPFGGKVFDDPERYRTAGYGIVRRSSPGQFAVTSPPHPRHGRAGVDPAAFVRRPPSTG